jgi:hypothetical protein
VELQCIDSISYETIHRVLKKRNKTLEEAMENVLDTYKRPYNPEFPVVCMDETGSVGQLLYFFGIIIRSIGSVSIFYNTRKKWGYDLLCSLNTFGTNGACFL